MSYKTATLSGMSCANGANQTLIPAGLFSGKQATRNVLARFNIDHGEGDTLDSPFSELLDAYVTLVRGIVKSVSVIPLHENWPNVARC